MIYAKTNFELLYLKFGGYRVESYKLESYSYLVSGEKLDFPLDPAFIISIVALAIAIITLWLTELRGPDITLVNDPEFKISDSSFNYLTSGWNYTPFWFELESVSFLFANYGGKDGTILDLKIDFVPNSSFKHFNTFSANLPIYVIGGEFFGLPLTVKEGSNQYLKFSPRIDTIRWKESALAEELNPKLKVADIVENALAKSKVNFSDFCDFLESSKDIGKVKCTITLTKGRFRTKIRDQAISKEFIVANKCEKSIGLLRECLLRWEDLSETRAEMENKLVQDIKFLIRGLEVNATNLANSIDDNQLSQAGASIKLRLDEWKSLQNSRGDDERKIRWFMLKTDKSLEEKLSKFYNEIVDYNNSVDRLVVLGENRTSRDFNSINAFRERLREDTHEIKRQLSDLQKKFMKSAGCGI